MASTTLDGFKLALRDVSDADLERGVMLAIDAGGPHPPCGGDLRKLCIGQDRHSIEARAQSAWEMAERHASVEVNPRSLGDPLLVHAVGAIGGWRTFCCEPTNEWQRRNFVVAYINAAENPQLEEVAKLSHAGQPIGALGEVRKQLAASLRVLADRRKLGGQHVASTASNDRHHTADDLACESALLKRQEPVAIPF